MIDPREARLPKWAQEEFASLRRHVTALDAMVSEAHYDVGSTNVHTRQYPHADRPLPRHAHVVFTFESDQTRGQDVSVYFDERGRLTVQGDRSLAVHPEASNAFRIEIRD